MIRFNSNIIHTKIKKNIELFFLFGLIIVSVFIVQIYNFNKKIVKQNYIELINNTYLQNSLKYTFNNLVPKYINIEHKVRSGQSFEQILETYEINKKDIAKLKKIFI